MRDDGRADLLCSTAEKRNRAHVAASPRVAQGMAALVSRSWMRHLWTKMVSCSANDRMLKPCAG